MSKFFDALETRSADERNSALATRLPQQIAHAKANAPYFAESLKSIDAASINSVAALAGLPVVRKHDLIELQKQRRPFGGLAAGGWGNWDVCFHRRARSMNPKAAAPITGARRVPCMPRAFAPATWCITVSRIT